MGHRFMIYNITYFKFIFHYAMFNNIKKSIKFNQLASIEVFNLIDLLSITISGYQ